jgi:hypothetical protein
MVEFKSNVWIWIAAIIGMGVFIGVIIIYSNSNNSNRYVCSDGSTVSDDSLCLGQQNTETVFIVATRTKEQYGNLQKSFSGEAEISACNFDLHEKYPTNYGPCKVSSVTQGPNENYVIVCECTIYK